MDLEPLPDIILAMAQQQSLGAVLRTIIDAIARQPHVGLVRLWLLEQDQACPVCGDRRQHRERGLHLRASAGASLTPELDWTRIDGTFHWVPLSGDLKISHIALSGQSICIARLADDNRWVRFPEWARAEGLHSFAGHALIFRGEPLGVLAVFRRATAGDECFAWLKTMANAAAVAIANARAFERNEFLRRELEQERDYLREELKEAGSFGEIIGNSPPLTRLLQQVTMVAATEANVLVLGESGTGKELIARAIHQRSSRSAKPMVKVNCGSIPRELFESEFFGHVRGSFTGAVRDRVGRFQLADGGALFLDEVGEIPLELQSKLLRVLQEGEFERVGDDVTRRVNVRVIAATNRDLRKEVSDGRFRADLYYRLAVFPMEVPPLRERKEDIPGLISHFATQSCARLHLPLPSISKREIDKAQAYDWPGNIRELQHVLERAVILSRGSKLTLDLPEKAKPNALLQAAPLASSETRVIPEAQWRQMERANIVAALKAAHFRVSGKGGAAEILGINPATLTSRLKALGIDARELRKMGGG